MALAARSGALARPQAPAVPGHRAPRVVLLRAAAPAAPPAPAAEDVTASVVADEAAYVLQTYARPADVVFVRGQGSKLYDANGREFLDMAAGACVCPSATPYGGAVTPSCCCTVATLLRLPCPHVFFAVSAHPALARVLAHTRTHHTGIAVNALGHGDARWLAALTEQAGTLAHTSNLFHTLPQVQARSGQAASP